MLVVLPALLLALQLNPLSVLQVLGGFARRRGETYSLARRRALRALDLLGN